MFKINMQLPTVGFEPWSSHTAVRHVTARPLRSSRDKPVKCDLGLSLGLNMLFFILVSDSVVCLVLVLLLVFHFRWGRFKTYWLKRARIYLLFMPPPNVLWPEAYCFCPVRPCVCPCVRPETLLKRYRAEY